MFDAEGLDALIERGNFFAVEGVVASVVGGSGKDDFDAAFIHVGEELFEVGEGCFVGDERGSFLDGA